MLESAGYRKPFTFMIAPLIAAAFILTVGSVAICNASQELWVLNYRLADLIPIGDKTGTVFILAALALAFRSFLVTNTISRVIANALASVFALCVLVAGASALLQYFFGFDLGLEFLFAKIGVQGKFWLYESPLAGLGFVLVGFCLLLLDFRTSGGHYPSEYIAFIVIGMMGIPLVGHLYNVMSVGVVDAARTLPPFMSVTFLILGLGILAARPSHKLMRLWNSQSPGGPVLRRLLPNSLMLLIVLDFAIKWGVQNRLYDADKASPLLIMLSSTLLFIMFCRTAVLLNREYEERQIGEAALAESNALLRAVSDNTPDAIFVKDLNGSMIFANPAKLRLLGKQRRQVIGLRSEDLYLKKSDAERVNKEDLSVILEGKAMTFEATTRYECSTRTMLSTKAPWLDAKGQIMGLVGISTDITERKHMEDALKAHETQLEALVAARTFEVSELIGHLETTREEEKRAIARELHDDLGAALTALNMHLSLIFQQMPPEPKFTERSAKIKVLLSSITDATRRIQNGLRPDKLDVFGVKIAIAEQAAEFEKYTGIVCNVNLPDDQLGYAPRVDIALFRIVQEALNNIAKHAKATHIDVVLDDVDHEIVLTVRDNGVGIPAANPDAMTTHGLRGMRERVAYLGGSFKVSGVEGKGTTIVITIPKTPKNTTAADDNAIETNN